MSWLQYILKTKPRPEEPLSPAPAYNRSIMPTVKFDASLFTKKVKADFRKSAEELEDVPKEHVRKIYDAALAMIEAGGNMPLM
jgi:hypothetical protein